MRKSFIWIFAAALMFVGCGKEQYTITVDVDNTGHGYCTGSGTFDEGSYATIHANANSGFIFTYWIATDTANHVDTIQETNPYRFKVLRDMNFKAYFKATTWDSTAVDTSGIDPSVDPTHYYTISAITPNGTPSCSMGTTSGSGQYLGNTQATVSAVNDSGYVFSHWVCTSPEGVPYYTDTLPTHTFTVTRDAVYTAYFTKEAPAPESASL